MHVYVYMNHYCIHGDECMMIYIYSEEKTIKQVERSTHEWRLYQKSKNVWYVELINLSTP